MQNIFEKVREAYEKSNQFLCDVPQGSEEGNPFLWDLPQESNVEEKLQYLILKQRYKNLGEFLNKQQEKYAINDQNELKKLKNLLFYYNDLKEMNFIGTDMYANALFLKHQVPYLYRSVGKDTNEDRIFGNEEIEYTEHTKTIFQECLRQIETGGKGQLFSYTKCFGKMLYKYATLQNIDQTIVIEVRQNAIINTISEDGEKFISIQEYIRKCKMQNEKGGLPYFAIDMSNARDNSVECLKYWITEFLGKQDWYWHKDIVDPIGDAEVVCNFTNESKCRNCDNVQRMTFSRDEFCILLYMYFSKYAEKIDEKEKNEKNEFKNWFDVFIFKTLGTLECYSNGNLQCYYKEIISNVNELKQPEILSMIDWNNEIKYMTRRKGEIQEQKREPAHMGVYKGDNAEEVSKIWKEILFSAVEGKYSYIDYGCSNQK